MRPVLHQIVDELVRRHRAGSAPGATGRVDLDDIDEVIGPRSVSFEDVEAIVAELEDRGLSVGGPLGPDDLAQVLTVVGAARELKDELGRAPTVDAIAERVALPPRTVRRALHQARRAR